MRVSGLGLFQVWASISALTSSQVAVAQISCEPAYIQGMPAHSITAAMSKYKTVDLKKDEFETTAAYQARVEAARSGLPQGPILVSIPQSSLTKFDADSGVITVSPYSVSSTCLVSEYGLAPEMKALTFGEPSRYGVGSAYCLTKVIGSEDGGTYDATNGYGAKVTVEKARLKSQGAFFGMGDFGQPLLAGRKAYSSDPLFSFSASVEEARSLKDNAEVAVLLRPAPPFTGKGSYYSKPTFDNPRETFFSTDFLVGSPICIAIRDSKSGKIFAALPAGGQ